MSIFLTSLFRLIFLACFATSLYFSGKYFYISYYPGEAYIKVSNNADLIKSNDSNSLFEGNNINCDIGSSNNSDEKNSQHKHSEIDKQKIIAIIKEFIDKNPEYIKNAIKD